jgi:hypothetical protein
MPDTTKLGQSKDAKSAPGKDHPDNKAGHQNKPADASKCQ